MPKGCRILNPPPSSHGITLFEGTTAGEAVWLAHRKVNGFQSFFISGDRRSFHQLDTPRHDEAATVLLAETPGFIPVVLAKGDASIRLLYSDPTDQSRLIHFVLSQKSIDNLLFYGAFYLIGEGGILPILTGAIRHWWNEFQVSQRRSTYHLNSKWVEVKRAVLETMIDLDIGLDGEGADALDKTPAELIIDDFDKLQVALLIEEALNIRISDEDVMRWEDMTIRQIIDSIYERNLRFSRKAQA